MLPFENSHYKMEYLCIMEWVQLEIANRLATVTMARIDKRNAFNPELVSQMFSSV